MTQQNPKYTRGRRGGRGGAAAIESKTSMRGRGGGSGRGRGRVGGRLSMR